MKRTVISLLLALIMVFSLVLAAAPAVQAAGHTDHCVCGGNGAGNAQHTCNTLTGWIALSNDASGNLMMGNDPVPTYVDGYANSVEATIYILPQGNYYLEKDVTLLYPLCPGQRNDENSGWLDCQVTLCLNGKNLNNPATANPTTRQNDEDRAFAITASFGTLNITDCAETDGTVTAGSTFTGTIMFQQFDSTTVNIYGGNFVGTGASDKAGGIIRQNSGNMNIYGGTISGGKAGTIGGNLYIAGVFNMYGGKIYGGQAVTKAGNIYLAKNGIMTLNGGVVGTGTCPTGETGIYLGASCLLSIVNVDESTVIYQSALDGLISITEMSNTLQMDSIEPLKRLNLTKLSEPVVEPTLEPTEEPTEEPTDEPTAVPTEEPTDEPTTGNAGNGSDGQDLTMVIVIAVAAVVLIAVVATVIVLKKKKA